MALIRTIGFDNYDPSIASEYFDVYYSGATPQVGSAGSRFGYGKFLILTGAEWAEWRLKKNMTVVYHGWAFKAGAYVASGTAPYRLIAYWYPSQPAPGHTQLSLVLRSDGKLEIRKDYASASPDVSTSMGANAVSTNVFPLNEWHYIECQLQFSTSTTIQCQVLVDGVAWITLPVGTNTLYNTTYPWVDSFGFGTETNSGVSDNKCYDDVYFCDNSGSANNTLLGDCRVETLMPNAAGSSTQWTPFPAATQNYADVDETFPDNDLSYVTTASINNRDLYQMGDLSQTPKSIIGVQAFGVARVDASETARKISYSLKSGGTVYDSADQWTLKSNNAYFYYSSLWETDPATGLAFTAAGVNALEAGIKLVN